MKRAMVVYESMFGNTHAVADAVAEGLGSGVEVTVVDVTHARTSISWSSGGRPTRSA
jgi:flavodoxin